MIFSFFNYIISLKDLLFFILWIVIDTTLFFIITKDFTITEENEPLKEKKRKARKKRVIDLQLNHITISFLLVLTINVFIKNTSLPLSQILGSVGIEADIKDSFGILITILYLPTFFKISQEFKKNSERKKKEEGGE